MTILFFTLKIVYASSPLLQLICTLQLALTHHQNFKGTLPNEDPGDRDRTFTDNLETLKVDLASVHLDGIHYELGYLRCCYRTQMPMREIFSNTKLTRI